MSVTNTIIPWRRFWYSRESEAKLDSDGFLADPEHESAKYSPPELLHSTETLDDRCVVFLGEPSSGKSKTVGREGADRQELEARIQDQGNVAVWVDLRDYDASQDLAKAIENEATIAQWKTTDGQKLFLFMDSLDECRLSVPTISNVLIRELGKLPADRLMLRLVCRTAEWPTFLESELQKLYRQELRVLQLGPLRKRDVEMAAGQVGVDAVVFLQKIQELNAAPFARKPFTLIQLLRAFSRNEQLPNTNWGLDSAV